MENDEIGANTPKKTGKEKRVANLKQAWKKGESGNPKGRPIGSISLVEVIRRRLMELTPDKKRTFMDALGDKIISGAMAGSEASQRLILNYLEGMPKQGLDIKHDLKDILTQEQIDELFLRRTKKDNAGGKA